MLTKSQLERYSRHILLKDLGGQGQQKLLQAKICVVGAGGLGSPVLAYLAAAGIGTIHVIDPDHVDISNLQRQIIHTMDEIGNPKVISAKNSMLRINPEIDIQCHQTSFDESNCDDLIKDYDLIIEGVDNFKTRFILNKAALKAKKTWISAAVGPFNGQLSVFKPHQNPGTYPFYRCFVPEEPPRDDQFHCDTQGILGPLTGVMGSLVAMEAIKEIADIGESLAGHILLYDGLTSTSRKIKLYADPHCPDCSQT